MSASLQVEFGKRVRELRIAAGLSQEDFAAQANIDRATYGKLERGAINASLLTIARIAVALGIDLAGLVDGVALDAEQIRAAPRSARGPKPIGKRSRSFKAG